MAEPLWTSADIALATGGQASGLFTAGGLSIDTRSLQPGDLFIALADRRDGHDFVSQAFAAGASGALVSRDVEADGPLLKVADVLAGVEAMAVAARARSPALRCAVTGSVGKTSVKEMLARIFRAAGPAHWPDKSFNNHWGVPLTLARMPQQTQRAVFEIGMSTPGEIAPRSRLVRPHHALVTKIAPAHLEGLGSIEAVADEKADIFAGLEAGGTIIVPADDRFRDTLADHGRRMCPTASVESFGKSDDATARLVGLSSDGERSTVEIVITGQQVRFELEALGEHWAINAAAALLMASLTDIRLADAADALSGYAPPAGRGNVHWLNLPGQDGQALLIDDAYNANPESMRAALAALSARPVGRRLVALGEMLELGEGTGQAHAGLATQVKATGAEMAFLCGAGMAPLAQALHGQLACEHVPDAESLVEIVKNSLRVGDVLLIKGSNASGMHRLVGRLRQWGEAGPGEMGSSAESAARGKNAV